MDPKMTVSACPGAIHAQRTKAVIKPAAVKKTGLLTVECLCSSEESVSFGSSEASLIRDLAIFAIKHPLTLCIVNASAGTLNGVGDERFWSKNKDYIYYRIHLYASDYKFSNCCRRCAKPIVK